MSSVTNAMIDAALKTFYGAPGGPLYRRVAVRSALEAAIAAASKPVTALSDDQIIAIAVEHSNYRDGPQDVEVFTHRRLVEFARDIEARTNAANSLGENKEWPELSDAFSAALRALSRYLDTAHVDEANWSGWGDQIVPPYAEMRRVKATQALSALRDSDPRLAATMRATLETLEM